MKIYIGLVAGYGFTEVDGLPSNKLKKIELPIVDIKQCKREAPDECFQTIRHE